MLCNTNKDLYGFGMPGSFDRDYLRVEITLPELEQLAAEKQAETADQDDPTWGEFELGDLEKAKQEAQARYEAALAIIPDYHPAKEMMKDNENSTLNQALRIASGLEQITPNTDTKSDNQ